MPCPLYHRITLKKQKFSIEKMQRDQGKGCPCDFSVSIQTRQCFCWQKHVYAVALRILQGEFF